MKSLRNPEQKKELLLRLQRVGPSSERLWGSMSSHQMICHLSDGYRLYMGEINAPLHPIPIPRWILRTITIVGSHALAARENTDAARTRSESGQRYKATRVCQGCANPA